MERIKILHLADVHFDSPFSELPVALAEERKEDLRKTFGDIMDRAKEEKVDIILIAGDLFDNSTVMRSTLDFILGKFREMPEINIFISPGNHDPYNNKSFYSLIDWPENLHIFKESYGFVELPEKRTIIHGIGFSQAHERESLLKGIKGKEGFINIMVLHGDISNGGVNDYNPFTKEEIRNSSMDYIALGHRHEFSGILREGQTSYAYSGNIEGRGFDETGAKGMILGTVAKGSVALEFISMEKRRYQVLEADISPCLTYDGIKETIIRTIGNDKKGDLFKITLKGEVEEHFRINLDILQQRLQESLYYVKLLDKTTVALDIDEMAQQYTLRGIYAKKMKEAIEKAEEEDKELYQEALKLGLQFLTGGELKSK